MLRLGSDSSGPTLRSAISAFCFFTAVVAAPHGPARANSGAPDFDADRAFSYLEAQTSFGPRAPGAAGHGRALDYLCEFLAKRGARVVRQNFSVRAADSTVVATNIIAKFHERVEPRVLLCAHWDTRPWADSDPDSSRRTEPVLGANDGASGVAVLMEVANTLAEGTPLCGVDVVLFDAEDMGGRDGLEYALGSRYYVSAMSDPPAAVILLDLVGDSDLTLPLERYSYDSFPELAGAIWETAGELGLSQFRSEPHKYVYDDHVPFLQAGVPAVDVVDIEYEYWHTTADTPDKCSPRSLSAPGTLLLHILYDSESPLPSILEGYRP